MPMFGRATLPGDSASVRVTYGDGRVGHAPVIAMVSGDGQEIIQRETLKLITANAPAAQQSAYGGDYIFTVTGTFNGASVQLQALGPDGATWQNVGAAKTAPDANGGTGVGLGSAAIVRATITGGPPTGIHASLSRIPA